MVPATTQPTRFGLLRHGKTTWNEEKRIQGSGNSALTEKGVADSRKWARFLTTVPIVWHRLLVSPLQRTIDTAEIINERLGLPLHLADGFREMDWGEWEGLTLEEIRTVSHHDFIERIRCGWDFRPPGGESRREVLQRVTLSLQEQVTRWPEENLLVITHLGVIKALLYHIEQREFLPEEPKILWKNRFHIISSSDGRLTLEQSNMSLPEQP